MNKAPCARQRETSSISIEFLDRINTVVPVDTVWHLVHTRFTRKHFREYFSQHFERGAVRTRIYFIAVGYDVHRQHGNMP